MTNKTDNEILLLMEGQSKETQNIEPQTQPTPVPNSNNVSPKIFISRVFLIFIIVFLLITAAAGSYYFLNVKSQISNPSEIACTTEAKICPDGTAVGRTGPNCEFAKCPNVNPTPTDSGFKTYTNTKYGFELKYPAKGIIQEDSSFKEGECGQAIKENADGILVDNFFQIQILNWVGTINDYIAQKGAKDMYDLNNITNSNADEAIEVVGIKKGLELSSVGYPPLMYITNIYKKNSNLFVIMHKSHPPEPINPNGCLNPKDINNAKYPKYANLIWNITTSFKFLSPSSQSASLNNYCSKVNKNPTELTFEASYCNGDSCSATKTKTACESIDVVKISNNTIAAGQDGQSDCQWINSSCQPNK